jgi:hypothetical protein
MIDSTAMTAPASPLCLDCGAPISGNYCSNCGQETKIETPTVRQFAHEMMDQYVAVEGKLGRTLRVLVSKPGQLTLDYVHGRRQRYVRPLKLYVSVSVVFFTLLGVLPDSLSPFMSGGEARTQALQEAKKDLERDEAKEARAKADADDGDDDDTKTAQPSKAAQAAKAAAAASLIAPEPPKPKSPKVPAPGEPKAAQPQDPPLTGDLRQQIKQQIDARIDGKGGAGDDKTINIDVNPDRINADVHRQVDNALHEQGLGGGFKDRAKAFASLSPKEQQKELRAKLADDAPYAMFFLLPYFAFLLRILYRKNKLRYGVHLLFSVHLHCFMFIVLTLGFVPMPSFMHRLMELAVGVYVYFALHKVYGGTWGRTLWRMALLYMFYVIGVASTAVSGVFSAILGTGT